MKKELSAEVFLKTVGIISIVIITITVAINIFIDLYGLFRPVEGRRIVVHNNERITKYLLSKRYIPQNFNKLIIGTSLSDNLDVSSYNHKTKDGMIYNGSIMGASISELRPIVENAIEGRVKKVVFCLSPYLLEDSKDKEVEFNDKLYYGAYGSIDLYQTYAIAFVRHFNLLPNKFPGNQINEFGVNNYGFLFNKIDVVEKINEELGLHKDEDLKIDSAALNQFRQLIKVLEVKGVEIYGYFHPLPFEIYESNRRKYENFELLMKSILPKNTRLVNFNEAKFEFLTHNYSNFIDHGHLSATGQEYVLDSILPLLSQK